MRDRAKGTYTLQGATEVRATLEETMRWLAEPELMARWMLKIDSVEAVGAHSVRLSVRENGGRSQSIHAWSMLAKTVERAPDRLVRHYDLEAMGTLVKAPAPEGYYERTVAYDLRAVKPNVTRVTCSVTTTSVGLRGSGLRWIAMQEQRYLNRSLERLRAGVAGKRRGLIRRFLDYNLSPMPL